MIPWAKLNTRAGDDQPAAPQHEGGPGAVGARAPDGVRATGPATRIRAAGMSQEIWPPMSARNSRSSPVGPQREPAGPPPPDAARLVAR